VARPSAIRAATFEQQLLPPLNPKSSINDKHQQEVPMKTLTNFIAALLLTFALSYSTFAQTPVPGSLKAGQKVEVEYYPNSNKWVPATIIEVVDDGYAYKVKVAPYGDGKEIAANIHYKRVRAARSTAGQSAQRKSQPSSALVYGKYGCTASKYNGGTIEYIPRGSFTISKNGKYTYYGFKKPSQGTFTVDRAGNLFFKGGYFDGGKAEKIDRPNKFFLVFPANPDNRWTCGLVEKKG
jgi:hypothetical protein